MQALGVILFFAIMAALAGVIKPYYRDWSRKRFLAIAAGLFVFALVIAPEPTPEQKAARAAEQAAEDAADAKAEEERLAREAEEEAEENKRTARQLLAMEAKSIIRNAARNPDSVSFSSVGVSEDLSLVCVEYRAQNGFGGMNVETVAFKDGSPNQSAGFWNSNCAGDRGLHNMN